MKKIIIAMLLPLVFIVSAQAVTVSSASYFQGLYVSGGVQDIELAESLIFDNNRLGSNGSSLNMTVNLGTYTLSFLNNYASTQGGAIDNNNSTINFTSGTVNFTSNSTNYNGGAISNANNSTINFTSGTVNFTGNSTAGSYTYGGAMSNYNSTINFTSGSVIFAANSASNGGAIYNNHLIINNTIIIFISLSLTFSSNSASLGVAIFNFGTINFTSGTVNFTGNSASGGGAISNHNSTINFTSGTVNFTSNSANYNGGAIYNIYSTINFTSGSVIFAANSASCGGAIYNSGGTINFTSGTVNFTGNSASDGGAIYNNNSTINFTSGTVNFTSNSTNYGGVIYNIQNSTITFSASRAAFTNNYAYGVMKNDIYNAGILNVLNGSYVELAGGITGNGVLNISNSGKIEFGAVNSRVGSLNIDGTSELALTIDFVNNLTSVIYVDGNITLIANTSKLSLTTAGSGILNKTAVIYVRNSTMPDVFAVDSGYKFIWEAATGTYGYIGYLTNLIWNSFVTEYKGVTAGGTITLGGSITAIAASGDNNPFGSPNANNITIDGAGNTLNAANYKNLGFVLNNFSVTFKDISFENFVSISSGGAMYAVGGSAITISGNSSIRNNIAYGSGGGIYLKDSYLLLDDNGDNSKTIEFIGNEAWEHGGAIYAESSNIEIEGTLNFKNNYAYKRGGAIYAAHSSTITINSTGGGIIFSNNEIFQSLFTESNDIYLDNSKLFLYGTNNIKFNGGISGNSLSEITKNDNNTVYLGGKTEFAGVLIVLEGSLCITTSNVTIAEINVLENAILTGTTVHTTYAEELNVKGKIQINVDLTNNTADKYIILSGTTTLSSGSKWSVLPAGNSRADKVYTILESDFIVGEFSNAKLNIANRQYSLEYYQNRIDLLVDYEEQSPLKGVTKNQKSIAGLFNRIYFDEESLSARPEDIVRLTSDIFELRNTNAAFFQQAIENLSGKFYADIIMSAAAAYNNSILFNRLNPDLLSFENGKNLWAQAITHSKILPSDEKQLGNFKNTDIGAMFGADIVCGKTMVIGLFGQYLTNEYLQDDNRAYGQELGFGLYAFKVLSGASNINLKSSLSYNSRKVNAKRSFTIADTYNPEAEFNLSAIKLTAEAEKNFKIKEKLSMSPFVGVQGAAVFNGAIKEKGGNTANLTIDEGANGQLYGTFGINANYNISKVLALYGGFNGRAAIFGQKGTIKEVLSAQKEQSVEIESAKEVLYLGIDLRLDYKIGNNFIVYLNGAYGTSSEYLVGLGLSYRVISVEI